MRVLFDFYDFDRDGIITSLDILNLIQNVPEGSIIHKEVKILSDFFVQETITRKINRRPYDFFNYENFAYYINSREYKEEFSEVMLKNNDEKHIRTQDTYQHAHGLNFFEAGHLKFESFIIKALKNYLCEYDEGMNDYFQAPGSPGTIRRGVSINDNIFIA